MAQYIISLIIICIVALIMIAIGISQIKSQDPVGFYTGQQPPKREQLTNVRQWNKKHGMMWIIWGIAIICTYFIGIFAQDSLYCAIAMAVVIFCGLILMIWYHSRLKKRFYK